MVQNNVFLQTRKLIDTDEKKKSLFSIVFAPKNHKKNNLMRGSHIADYCSRLRSDSDTTRKVKKSD